MSRTRGQASNEASASITRGSLWTLFEAFAAVAPQRGNQRLISLVHFDLLVQHTPITTDLIFTTKFKGCRYLGDSDDMKDGNESDVIELTLNPLEIANILRDGTEIVLI